MTELNAEFWNERYLNDETGWDLGQVSPPIKEYIDGLGDKSISVLIPGAGNAYEADYLLEKGFTNITIIDIAPKVVERLKNKWKDRNEIRVLEEDFFMHSGNYDLIIEQTFFCAIDPGLRKDYIVKMKELLKGNGKLVGVLFDREFHGGPPFGGNMEEYKALFSPHLKIEKLEPCYNSIAPRKGSESWIKLTKNG